MHGILALVTVLAASGWAADDVGPPPEGVSIEVLPAAPDAETVTVAPAALPQVTNVPRIELSYEGVPFSQVLEDLRQRLDVMVLCDDEQLLKRIIFRHVQIPQTMALGVVCGSVFHYPAPTYIFCTSHELRAGKLRPTIESRDKYRVKLEDARLADALSYFSKVSGVALQAMPSVGDKRVTCECPQATVEEAAQQIAKAAGIEVTTGFSVEPIPIERELRRLEQMTPEELERVFQEGLRGADQFAQQMGGGPENPATAQQLQAGMRDQLKMMEQLTPEERARLIQRGANLIQRFAALTQRLSPQTQAQLRQRAQPFVALAVAGYVALPGPTRAELSPLMNALRAFGW